MKRQSLSPERHWTNKCPQENFRGWEDSANIIKTGYEAFKECILSQFHWFHQLIKQDDFPMVIFVESHTALFTPQAVSLMVEDYLIKTPFTQVMRDVEWIRDEITHHPVCDFVRLQQHPLVKPFPLSPLYKDYDAELAITCGGTTLWLSSAIFRILNTISCFLRKLRVKPRDGMVESLFEGFLASENSCAQVNAQLKDETMSDIITSLSDIISDWLSDIDLRILPCRHGTGTTAEKVQSLQEKYDCMKIPLHIEHFCFLYGVPYDPTLLLNPCSSYAPGQSSYSCARMTHVPKTWKSLRGINCEPIANQWAQQGVMQVLYDHMHTHKYLRKRADVYSQERNQRFARLASKTNKFATLDLSAASDSVSLGLVERLFADTTVCSALLLTRSTHTDISKVSGVSADIRLLEKYAPMGNATTFPVETLIFAAVCELACRYAGLTDKSRVYWSVYGDDMIIHVDAVRYASMLLRRLGFTLNAEKSFTDGSFRESCGKEFFLGVDVTPFYFRGGYTMPKLQAKHFVQLLDYCHNCEERPELSELKEYFIRTYESALYKKFIRYSTKGKGQCSLPKRCKWVPIGKIPRGPYVTSGMLYSDSQSMAMPRGALPKGEPDYQTSVFRLLAPVNDGRRKKIVETVRQSEIDWYARKEYEATRTTLAILPEWNREETVNRVSFKISSRPSYQLGNLIGFSE